MKVNFVFRAAVNEAKVLKDLKRLKRKKATGLDDLPSGLLKHAAPVIEKPVTFIINLSLHGKCLLNGKWLKCCHSSNLGLHYIAKPDSYIHRTRWGICLSRQKISNMTDIFLSALRGEILTKTPPHTRGNSWANCLARSFAKLFPLVCGGL